MAVKFAICNELFEGWEFAEAFGLISSLGYNGVEIAPFTFGVPVADISAERRSEVRELASSCDLEIVGLHWLLARTEGLHINSPDAEVRRRTVDYLKELVRLCSDLGGKIMVFGSPQQRSIPPGLSYREAWDLTKRSFAEVMSLCADLGVTICIEPLGAEETDCVNTAAEAMRMVDEMNHPNFKMILDVKAMCADTAEIPEIIRSAAGYFKHLHANDANRRGPGSGDTDFRPIAAALREVGYDGYVSVEVFDFEPDPETIARGAIAYLREVFAENDMRE